MTTGASNPRAARAKASFGTILSTAVTLLIYGALIWEMWSIWTRPVPADFPRLQTLALIMGFEFLLVHSGLMAAVMPRKVSLFFILPVYGVVAYFLNLGAENNLILFLRVSGIFTEHPHLPLIMGLVYFSLMALLELYLLFLRPPRRSAL